MRLRRKTGGNWHFLQYAAARQWKKVRSYAAEKGIAVIGDLPLYVAYDSADVWKNPHLFKLDEERKPVKVAGVPPDYFSAEGQLWGNPVYDYAAHEKENFAWWAQRAARALKTCDFVRIDHFRGLDRYFEIPAGGTAAEGRWEAVPHAALFRAIAEKCDISRFIAEDLGILDEGVYALRERLGVAGMSVLSFAFNGDPNNPYLPEKLGRNTVCYTGTHDNNTVLGWLWEAQPYEREHALKYCAFPGGDWAVGGSESASCHAIIRTLWQSPANTVIVPVQDLCGFGKDTKMNVPGVPNGNWAFRVTQEQLDGIDKKWLKELNDVYYRSK